MISIILPKNIFLHKKKQQDWLVFLIWFWSVKLFRNESKLAKWSQTWFGKTSYNFLNILCAKKWITLLFRENIPFMVRNDLKPTIFSYFYPIPGLITIKSCALDILFFCQITMFVKVCMAFVFGLQTLWLIYFTKNPLIKGSEA